MAGKFVPLHRDRAGRSSGARSPALRMARGSADAGEIGLQDPVTPIADSIHTFHNGILLWTAILDLAAGAGAARHHRHPLQRRANPTPSRFTHNTLIEVVWTALPVMILVIIAIPSFAVLTDQLTMPDGARKYLGSNIFSFGAVDVPAPAVTIKVTGSQWYWTYEYVDQGKSFDSDILSEEARLAQTPAAAAPARRRQHARRSGQRHRPRAGHRRRRDPRLRGSLASASSPTPCRAASTRPGSTPARRASTTASAASCAARTTPSCRSPCASSRQTVFAAWMAALQSRLDRRCQRNPAAGHGGSRRVSARSNG